ncbi:hypothetical protein ACJX0J_012567, partial [Zea mays]
LKWGWFSLAVGFGGLFYFGQGPTKFFLSLLHMKIILLSGDKICLILGTGVLNIFKHFSTLFLISKEIWQNWFDKFWMNNTQKIHFRLLAPNLHKFGQDPIDVLMFSDVLMVIWRYFVNWANFIWSGSSRLVTMW